MLYTELTINLHCSLSFYCDINKPSKTKPKINDLKFTFHLMQQITLKLKHYKHSRCINACEKEVAISPVNSIQLLKFCSPLSQTKKHLERDKGSGTQTCVAIMRKRRVHNLMCVIECVMRQTTHTLFQSLITVNKRETLS